MCYFRDTTGETIPYGSLKHWYLSGTLVDETDMLPWRIRTLSYFFRTGMTHVPTHPLFSPCDQHVINMLEEPGAPSCAGSIGRLVDRIGTPTRQNGGTQTIPVWVPKKFNLINSRAA